MITLNLANTADIITVTLSEKVTLSIPFYLFAFTHTQTKTVIKKVFAVADDISGSERYNQFTIDTAAVFLGMPTGEYTYRVFEQSTNTTTINGHLIEAGKMELKSNRPAVYTMQELNTSYTAYNG